MEQLEGRLSVLAALRACQRRFQVVLLRQGLHSEKVRSVVELAEARGVPIRWVPREELDRLTHGATHGGVIALCGPKPRTSPAELLDLVDRLSEPALLLLLEGIDDARNLGFTLRAADALGAHAVLIKKHLWDFDAIEVARPASGAYERLPLVQIEGTVLLKQLRQRGLRLVGCLAGARLSVYDAELTRASILAVGGEKRGLSGAVREMCDQFVTVPTRDGASLSLSSAASILLAEARRQRLAAGGAEHER